MRLLAINILALRRKMRIKNLSIRKLAKEAGISTTTLHRLLNTKQDRLKEETLAKIAKELAVSQSELTKTYSRKDIIENFNRNVPF
jgi:DNA-binding Xre family transcriptional regulator